MHKDQFSDYRNQSVDVNLNDMRPKLDLGDRLVKVIDVFVKSNTFIYRSYQMLNILKQNQIITIYNQNPGKIKEVYIQAGDWITSQSSLFQMTYDENVVVYDIEKLQQPNKRKPKQTIKMQIEKEKNTPLPLPKINEIVGHTNKCFQLVSDDYQIKEVDFNMGLIQYTQQTIEYLENL